MIISAKHFTATTSTLATDHTHIRPYTVQLATEGNAVSYQLQGVDEKGVTCEPIFKPMPHQTHPKVAYAFVQLIDLWFSDCPWQQMPSELVRELLDIRARFHGAYIESL